MICAIAVATHPVGQPVGHCKLYGSFCPHSVEIKGATATARRPTFDLPLLKSSHSWAKSDEALAWLSITY